VVVVFDSSGSMSSSTFTADGGTKLPDGGHFTRYEAGKEAVKEVTGAHADSVRFGLELFGLNGGGLSGCRVSSPTCFYPSDGCESVLSDYRTYTQIGGSLDLYAKPAGATPTGAAIEKALARADSQDESRGRYFLLVTDGEPNDDCGSGATRAQSQAHALSALSVARLDAGVRTFILAFPVPAQFEINLDQMADAGGTARAGCQPDAGAHCYYSANSSVELSAALEAIITAVQGEVGRLRCDDSCYGQGCPVGKVCRTLDADDGPSCTVDPCSNVQCGAGQVCVEGACQAVCQTPCALTDRCENGACVAQPACQPACSGVNQDCVDGQCVENYCSGKSATLACPANTVCIRNSCFPLGSTSGSGAQDAGSSSPTSGSSTSGCSAAGGGPGPWVLALVLVLVLARRGAGGAPRAARSGAATAPVGQVFRNLRKRGSFHRSR
jgi:uncharacterized protein (TIGR03382 family)